MLGLQTYSTTIGWLDVCLFMFSCFWLSNAGVYSWNPQWLAKMTVLKKENKPNYNSVFCMALFFLGSCSHMESTFCTLFLWNINLRLWRWCRDLISLRPCKHRLQWMLCPPWSFPEDWAFLFCSCRWHCPGHLATFLCFSGIVCIGWIFSRVTRIYSGSPSIQSST